MRFAVAELCLSRAACGHAACQREERAPGTPPAWFRLPPDAVCPHTTEAPAHRTRRPCTQQRPGPYIQRCLPRQAPCPPVTTPTAAAASSPGGSSLQVVTGDGAVGDKHQSPAACSTVKQACALPCWAGSKWISPHPLCSLTIKHLMRALHVESEHEAAALGGVRHQAAAQPLLHAWERRGVGGGVGRSGMRLRSADRAG